MRVSAIQKTTLLDYPGHIACTLFLPGCNLRCPFCHNAGLVLPEQISPDKISEEELFSFLRRREGKLDGVCITGGEPTLQGDLPQLIRNIRDMGFLVKLDTNGTNPGMLSDLIEQGLVDYVAMDIKNCPARYRETCGGKDVLEEVKKSVSLLMEEKVDYEFRTTVSETFHDDRAIAEIARWLRGARRYFLQSFVDSGNLVGQGSLPLTEEKIRQFLQIASREIPSAQVRGI